MYILSPMPHVLEYCFSLPSLYLDVLPLVFIRFFPFPFRFPECRPSCRPTHTQHFYTLIPLSSLTQLPQEYCWECVRTTINTRGPSRSGCVSAPGMSTAVNSFAALLSAIRHSTTGCWMLQRRQGILSSRVCWGHLSALTSGSCHIWKLYLIGPPAPLKLTI